MFRKMRRYKQQLLPEACTELLKTEKRGVLSVLGEHGYPYGIPLNHYFCEAEGILYFHSAQAGHKIDALQACDKVCYTVYDEGVCQAGEWARQVQCVVVFGRMQFVRDTEKAREICTAICRKFTDDEAYLQHELAHALPRVQCLALIPEHMSGKQVTES